MALGPREREIRPLRLAFRAALTLLNSLLELAFRHSRQLPASRRTPPPSPVNSRAK